MTRLGPGPDRWRVRGWAPAWLLMTLLAASLGGCTLLGAAGAVGKKLGMEPPVPAVYVPAPEPTLVLVENYRLPSPSARDSEVLARLVTDELMKYAIAPVVPPESAAELKSREPGRFHAMTIADVGRALGASQVLYIDLLKSTVESPIGSDMVRGQMAVRVRIVDVQSGESRWPADAGDGYPLSYETPLPDLHARSDPSLVRQQMHRGTAVRIVRLFRKWKTEEMTAEDL